jgi:HEAT repeat protein
VLGYGGAGHEAAVAGLVGHDDERVAREALRALARIGTDAAAGLIAYQIREGSAERRVAAEEALWHFPPAQATAQARVLLRSRDFVRRHPQTVARLLDRMAQIGSRDFHDVLAELEPLRFRFWNPGLARVGFKARGLRSR